MRLTRRGVALLFVVGTAFALAQAHGARSLGVVVFSGAVALVAAVWQVSTATVPSLTREFSPEGAAGDHHTVRVRVGSTDTGQLGVRDHLSAGLRASPPDPTAAGGGETGAIGADLVASVAGVVAGDAGDATTPTRWAAPGATVAYDLVLQTRGEWTIGPAEVVVRDVFGLFERVYEVDDTDTVLVFPRVRRLTPAASRRLHALAAGGTGGGEERTVFDGLREYDTGDPLRDINWRISAKRDELIVTEYAAGRPDDRVTIATTATPDRGDDMAEAAASVAVSLLDAGVSVELRLPGATVTAGPGEQRAVLAPLARARVDDADRAAGDAAVGASGDDADVHIDATTDDLSVRLGDTHTRFEALVGEPSAPPEPTDGDDPGWFSQTRTAIARRRNEGDSHGGRTAP